MALGIEALDELVDGTKSAALPLIRGDLHLSYSEIGLLVSVPLIVGGLLELPFGLLPQRRRNQIVLVGGVVLALSLAAVAAAANFPVLLVAFVAFFPASGAFVGMTQAALMDRSPGRHQQAMAAWNFAGSAGAVGGPLLLAAVLIVGGTWRTAYLLLAGIAVATIVAAALAGPARRPAVRAQQEPDQADRDRDAGPPGADDAGEGDGGEGGASEEDGGEEEERAPLGEALRAVRRGEVSRWLILLQVIDLLLDVFGGYLGIYLVDVVHASPALAAVGVAVNLGAGLAGDALFVAISGRVSGRHALMVSAIAAAVLYPSFLLLPSVGGKLVLLAALSIVTACWYPVVQAGLYGSLPGQSGIAVFWSSAAGIAGAAGPLAVGLIAQQAGLGPAVWCLAIAPVIVLVVGTKEKR